MADEPLPATVNLTLWRGDTRIWNDTIETNTGTDLAPVWVPYDLTGHTFLCQIREGAVDANGNLRPSRTGALKATIACTALAPTSGVVTFTLTAIEADGLDVPTCFWDFQITRTSDSFRRTHLAGKVTVKGDTSNV
jgi:hypothetical protein